MSSTDPTDFNNPDVIKLTADDVDNLGHALIGLTKELWVVKDRLAILEAVLANKGVDVTEEIEKFQPDAELQEKLNADGAVLVRSVLNSMAGIADK